jgi:hypothetical protein
MLKRGTKPLRRTPLKKKSEANKKNISDNSDKNISDWDKDRAFYAHIWSRRSHICFESNAYLGNEPLSTYFNHVLDKESYPQFRYEEWNICLVSPLVHEQWHLDKKQCPKMYEYYLFLLKLRDNFGCKI